MAKYLPNTYTATYTLKTNPTTVTQTGVINVADANAVNGLPPTAWTLGNLGTIETTGTNLATDAISFAGGGLFVNVIGGLVQAVGNGIGINGAAGTVINSGNISSSDPTGTAVVLNNGGYVSNAHGALISGAGSGIQGFNGGDLTVINNGTIAGGDPANGFGIQLGAAGYIDNASANARITSSQWGAALWGGPGDSLSNSGTISSTGTNGQAVSVSDGGLINNGTSGVITAYHVGIGFFPVPGTTPAPLTIINHGQILSTQTGAAAGTGFFGTAIQAGTSAATYIHNFSLIQASGTSGGSAIQLGGGGTIVNDGAIFGGNDAISANNAPVTLINTGSVIATDTVTAGPTIFSFGAILTAGGTVDNSGIISASAHTNGIGVQLGNGGVVNNQLAGAAIIGSTEGVALLNGASTLTNQGIISASGTTGDGVNVFNGAFGLITNGTAGGPIASIAGYHIGIAFNVPGSIATPQTLSVVNFGIIESEQTAQVNGTINGAGINAFSTIANAILDLDNFGTVRNLQTVENAAGGGQGVLLVEGTITNEAGAVISSIAGNAVAVTATSGNGVLVTNFGTIENQATAHSNLYVGRGGGTIVNSGTAALIQSAARSAIAFGTTGGAGIVINSGTVRSDATVTGNAIYLGDGGSIANAPSGVIAAYRAAVSLAGVPATIDNSGTIQSSGTAASIYSKSGGLVTNYHNALIGSAQGTAISFNDTVGTTVSFGTVVNAGTIVTNTATKGVAVYFGQGGILTNQTTGQIIGAAPGMPVVGTTGGYPGVVQTTVTAAATIFNFGTITNPNNSTGINLLGGGYIENGSPTVTNALIFAAKHAIYAGGSKGVAQPGAIATIVNWGTIENSGGTASDGIKLAAGGVVANYGLIANFGGIGVNLANTAGRVANFGTILGSGTAAAGVRLVAGSTLTDAGLISGQSGTAVAFNGTVGSRLILDPGYNFANELVVGSGANGVSSTLELAAGNTVGTISGTGAQFVDFGTLQFDSGAQWFVAGGTASLPGAILGFAPGDTIEVQGFAASGYSFDPGTGLVLTGSSNNGGQATLGIQGNFTTQSFTVGLDAGGTDTLVTLAPPSPSQSPAVLNDFGWAQGWGSVDNPRMLADINEDGSSDYVGFGDNATFIAYGGTFGDGQGNFGPGFAPAVAAVNDFGTSEGYTADVQRGAANAGVVGTGDIIYGQGFAGVYWYSAPSSAQETDGSGHPYLAPQYAATPNFYQNFGSQEGWSSANGFQILKTTHSDLTASILGFGDGGIVVGPQAFSPGATADDSYVLDFAGGNSATTNAGNNFGWDQQNDIRTFTDANGKTLDLNGDGVADFVGMGPQGLEFAFGNHNGPNGSYQLGQLQQAQIGPVDLGDDQGWNDQSTLRYVVADPQTGFDDILAFGYAGVYVAMGQDPATHGGQPFGQLNLAMNDFGIAQGWSVDQTPRLVGDVNGDGVPDIVGFGFSNTFVALGSHDQNGNLQFAIDPNLTIGDFGSSQGWSSASPNLTVRALGQFPGATPGSSHADLVLSGAFNTQLWQFV